MKMNLKQNKGVSLVIIVVIIVAVLIIGGVIFFMINKNMNLLRKNEQMGSVENTQINNSKSNEKTTGWVYDSKKKKYQNGKESYALLDKITNEQVLEMIEIKNSTGTYKGTWQVIGLDGNKLKLLTTENVDYVTLGYKDEIANDVKTMEEYNAMTTSENMERGLVSYQRAMTTLNEKAKTATGISTAQSVRIQDIFDIIGEKDVDTDHGTNYSYNSGTFVKDGKRVVASNDRPVEIEDTSIYYTFTKYKNTEIGEIISDNYWLASPVVSCSSTFATFGMRYIADNQCRNGILFFSSAVYEGDSESKGVRAVISIN